MMRLRCALLPLAMMRLRCALLPLAMRAVVVVLLLGLDVDVVRSADDTPSERPGSPTGVAEGSTATAVKGTEGQLSEYWRQVEQAVLDGSAEERGLVEEGDMIVMPADLRNADADPASQWPWRRVVLELADGEWPARDRELLVEALRDIESESCVRFVFRTDEPDYLLLHHFGRSCASIVGFHVGAGGVPMFLGGQGCLRRGTIQHEMLHTLGLWHEHTRPDRDQHITVLWDHVLPGRESNFLKKRAADVWTLGLPYDYGSVMHYRALAFSKDGRPTIVPRDEEALHVMGQRRRFSQMDIAKLNTLYDCPPPYYRG